MKTIMLVFGTRPEAIKVAPLVKEFEKYPEQFKTVVCVTGQHREMLDQVLHLFEIHPDYDLNIMKQGQDLYDVTARVLTGMRNVLKEVQPDLVLVHGDTTTSTASALAAFYQQIPVGHVEAGLRTHNIYSPWPEEMNRLITGRIATYHFSPTQLSCQNLLDEGVKQKSILVTGNTVIDALYLVVDKIKGNEALQKALTEELKTAGYEIRDRRLVLITEHRRENFGEGFIQMCKAIKTLAEKYPETDFVIFSVYEDFSFARQALRLGELDYISKIEFDPEECDAILKKIVEKYQNKRREKAERNLRTEEDWEGENVRKQEEEFKSGRWIFDENELEKMSEQLSELPLRYAERILVSSFNHLQLSQRDKIPAFETMPELLNWIHSWLQNHYLYYSSKTDDISLCIRAVQYIQEHVTESVRAEVAADAVGMSRGYFSTKFREVTGETFHNCVIRYKMKTAAQERRV